MITKRFSFWVSITTFVAAANQLISQTAPTQLSPAIKDSIKFYEPKIENDPRYRNGFFSFCEKVINGDSYSNYDRLMLIAYEFDVRKKFTQQFEFNRLYPPSEQAGDFDITKEKNSKNEYDERSFSIRKYFGNPHILSKHLERMKQLLEFYETLYTGFRIDEVPMSDSQLQFYQAYTDCELILKKTDLSLLEEDNIRKALVNGAISFFDNFRNTPDLKSQITIHEALLEATYLLFELALKPISQLSFKEKRSLYRTTIERITQRVESPPTKLLFDRFKLLKECLEYDQINSLVSFCLFLARVDSESGNLAGAAYYLTEAIKFKRSIPDNNPNYFQILSQLYAEKADVFELADYYQYYNLANAAELRRISFELFASPENRLAYAQTLTNYAEILKKNFKLITAREKIKQAISIAPKYAKAHYVASKIYTDLFYVYEAIRSSNLSVEYAVAQILAEIDEYKKLFQELFDFFKRKGLPDPTTDGLSTREIFKSRIEFALEYNETLIKSVEKQKGKPIKKDEYQTFSQQTAQSEINSKSIAEEFERENFREKDELKEKVETLHRQIQILKDLLKDVYPVTKK